MVVARVLVGPVRGFGLGEHASDFGVELLERAVRIKRRIRADAGPIQRHRTQVHQPRLGAQAQRLDQHLCEGVLVAATEPCDRHVIRSQIRGQHPKRDVLHAAPLQRPRRPHPQAIPVEEKADHHRWVIGRSAVTISSVARSEPRQVQLSHHIDHEPDQMLLGQPVP